jgi:hypothetical protein
MKTDLAKTGGAEGREDTQWFTQGLAASILSAMPIKNRLWLDVGAGLGLSKLRISQHGFIPVTQDPAPDLDVDISLPLDEVVGQFGVVSAFDVIEHVENVPLFLGNLRRLSCGYVVISAPFNADSQYHFQLFNPQGLLYATAPMGRLVCAYELGEGWVKRRDYNIQDGFGGLVIYE